MNGGGGKSAGGGGAARHGSVGGANQRKKKGKPTRNNRTIGLYQSSGTRVGGGRPKRRGKPVSPAKSRNIG